jgi:predicted esterase YcpF (UPF0227 family)
MQYFYLHGFLSGPGSKKGEFLAQKCEERGIELLRPDLNDGHFSRMTISSQLAVVERNMPAPPQPVTLLSSSLGGYLAVLLAERHSQISKLILIAPAFEFARRYSESLPPGQLEEWKRSGFLNLFHYEYQKKMRLSYDIVEDALKYDDIEIHRKIETVIFHGINDMSVPYRLSIAYLEKNSAARLVLLNSDHSMLDQLHVIWSFIESFLKTDSRKQDHSKI